MTTPKEASRAFVYGDDIDTDILAPSAYLMASMEEMASHCLETLDPDFAQAVRLGDTFVAGQNLGIGSSREQAPASLKMLGIRTILAKSFARIFYRNALNLGVTTLVCENTERIRSGDLLTTDPLRGVITNLTTGEQLTCEPVPRHLLEMLNDGGLLPHLKKRLAGAKTSTS